MDSMLRRIRIPLTLLVGSPILVALLWRTVSGTRRADLVFGLWAKPAPSAWIMVASFILFELALSNSLPGRTCVSPPSPAGARVTYKINGLSAWAVTYIVLIVAAFASHSFSLAAIYDQLGPILTVCTSVGWGLSVFAYIRGRHVLSGADADERVGLLYAFAWGVELRRTASSGCVLT